MDIVIPIGSYRLIISLISVRDNMRIIGLDYGTKTVGVALSDESQIIASPHITIERKHATKLRQTYAQIEEIIREYEGDSTSYIFLSEMQFWINLNKIEAINKCNLSLGTELRISHNLIAKGTYAIPTLAAKYTF